MKVPMLNLTGQYQLLASELNEAVNEVLLSGVYIDGPKVKAFEENIKNFLGVKHAIGVASGSDALLLSLDALEIGKGDKVIIPAFAFYAAANAVVKLGGTPIFADVDPRTYTLDLAQVENILEKEKDIKTLIPVHMYGQACDMDRIMELAAKYDFKVIEDACDALNAETRNADGAGPLRKVGTLGNTGCFSFFPANILGAYGDAGLIVTNDDQLAKKLRILRDQGAQPRYVHLLNGYNSRIDTLQAAMLNVKINYLQDWTVKQQNAARRYTELFSRADIKEIFFPECIAGHSFSRYVIQASDRNDLAAYLRFAGIETEIHYPVPLHLQDCFYDLGYAEGDFPIAERVSRQVLSLPLNPLITDDEIGYVVEKIKEFYSERQRLLGLSCDLYS